MKDLIGDDRRAFGHDIVSEHPAWTGYDKIIVHVGLHKTGTTFCQRQLFPKISGAVFAHEIAETHALFLTPEIGDPVDIAAAASIREAVERAADKDQALIVSDEALGGRPFHQKFTRGVVAERIKASFPNAKILLTIREQRALIGSLYGQYLRYGYCSSLDAFLTSATRNANIAPVLDVDFYDYHRAARFYGSIFGPDAVAIVPMEVLLARPDALVGRLAELVGVEMRLIAEVATDQTELPASSSWAQAYLRLANRVVPQDSRALRAPSRVSPNAVAHKIDRLTPAFARRRGKARMAARINARIGAYFAASNRAFAADYGIDLAALGYS